jgi:hypothetical protein
VVTDVVDCLDLEPTVPINNRKDRYGIQIERFRPLDRWKLHRKYPKLGTQDTLSKQARPQGTARLGKAMAVLMALFNTRGLCMAITRLTGMIGTLYKKRSVSECLRVPLPRSSAMEI